MMNTRLIFLVTAFSVSTPVLGTDSLTKRFQSLEQQKQKATSQEQKKLEERSKGRDIQQKAGVVINTTDDIDQFIQKLPLVAQRQYPTVAARILNKVVNVVGVGVRAYGRRKEALQAITGTSEQVLEAATQSYETIKDLSTKLSELLGDKTLKKALEENRSSEDMTIGQRALNLFAPSNFLNTFNQFTDRLYITDNKATRWTKIKETAKALKEEEETFDDYIAMLQIKFLEKLIMHLHLQTNKDKYIQGLQRVDHNLETGKPEGGALAALDTAIDITNQKIQDLTEEASGKKTGFARLKQKVGKGKNEKALQVLKEEREKYVRQKEDLLQEIKIYQNTQSTPEDIKRQRAELMQKISEIKGRKLIKATPEELKDEINDLKRQVQNLQNDVNALKPASHPLPKNPSYFLRK